MTKVPNMMHDRPPEPDEDECSLCGHIERQHWWGASPAEGGPVPCSGVRFTDTAEKDGMFSSNVSRCLCTLFTIPEKPQARLI